MNQILTFLSLLLLILDTNSQWQYETTLPNDSSHSPLIYQVCIIDSTTSFAFGNVHKGQNYTAAYFAKRTGNGWNVIHTDLNDTVKAYCFTARDSLNLWMGTFSFPHDIYYSSNGGINWTLQYHMNQSYGGNVQSIEFSKEYPNIGYAFVDMGNSLGEWNGVRILKTTNAGQNWFSWEFPMENFSTAEAQWL